MDRDAIIDILKAHRAGLRAAGVSHAGVFGSVARDAARHDSDIDIVVALDPEARLSVFDYVGLKQTIADLFDGPVDVVNRDALKPAVGAAVASDAIYAF